MVDVITPREAWIEHDTEILELVDPILKVLSKAETLKNSNSQEPLMFSHKYCFCFRVVKKQIVTIQPAYDVSQISRKVRLDFSDGTTIKEKQSVIRMKLSFTESGLTDKFLTIRPNNQKNRGKAIYAA